MKRVVYAFTLTDRGAKIHFLWKVEDQGQKNWPFLKILCLILNFALSFLSFWYLKPSNKQSFLSAKYFHIFIKQVLETKLLQIENGPDHCDFKMYLCWTSLWHIGRKVSNNCTLQSCSLGFWDVQSAFTPLFFLRGIEKLALFLRFRECEETFSWVPR